MFVDLYTLEVVELRLVALELRVVVEVAGGAGSLKYNEAASAVPDSEVFARAIEAYMGENVLICDDGHISLAEAVHVLPAEWVNAACVVSHC